MYWAPTQYQDGITMWLCQLDLLVTETLLLVRPKLYLCEGFFSIFCPIMMYMSIVYWTMFSIHFSRIYWHQQKEAQTIHKMWEHILFFVSSYPLFTKSCNNINTYTTLLSRLFWEPEMIYNTIRYHNIMLPPCCHLVDGWSLGRVQG